MADTRTGTDLEDQENTEITLGTGKLLGIFFGLVLLCSLFFTMGYMMGRSNAAGSKTEIIGSETTGGSPAGKPSASDKIPTPAPVAVVSGSDNHSASAVAPTPDPAASSSNPPATLVPASASTSANPDAKPAAAATYLVQVAAVSKRDDADVLVSQLQKKQYPAFVGNNSGDALFHVLVGPLTDPKDAESMRSRLSADGYNAIVKSGH
jgi:cell division septation protein DedD